VAFHYLLGLLDPWQSRVAGVLAFLAAVTVVDGGEAFALCKERREGSAVGDIGKIDRRCRPKEVHLGSVQGTALSQDTGRRRPVSNYYDAHGRCRNVANRCHSEPVSLAFRPRR
jgi:hypothetical protein